MSDIQERLDQDMNELLASLPGLRIEDQKKLLLALVSKYTVLTTAPIELTYEDLNHTNHLSRSIYMETPSNLSLSNLKGESRDLTSPEVNQYCMFEAVVRLLNSKNSIRRLPNFKKGKKHG